MFSGLDSEGIDLSHNGTTSVAADTFSQSTSIKELDLEYNSLGTLPTGLLNGLTNLKYVWLQKNPGSKFTFTLEIERVPGTSNVRARVAPGAPFDMTATLSAAGGTLQGEVTTVTVRTGRTTSSQIPVENIDDATLTLGTAPAVPTGNFTGIATAVGPPVSFGNDGGTTANALSASFPSSRFASRSHTGSSDVPQVIVEFSEAVASFTKSTPSVTVTGGTITNVQPHTETGLEHAYIFWVRPSGNADVTFTLVADAACEAGGVCTAAGTQMTGVPATRTIPGPGETTAKESELAVSNATASEDDATIDFVVTLDPVSEDTVTVDYATSSGTASAGSDYTAKSGTLTFNANETSKTVAISILDDDEDESDETLTLTLSNADGAEIKDAGATGTITDNDDASSTALTATFENVPGEHDGETSFSFNVAFSADVAIGYAAMRDDAFTVDDGDVTNARRVDGRSDRWQITVEPDGDDDVAVTLPGNRACSTTGAICAKGDSPAELSNSPSATIAGPPATTVTSTPNVSIAGASGTEGTDSAIGFTVTLDEAATETVTVDYATSDGTATARADYTSTSGTLSFDAGTTSKTISVPIADDTENENDETFTLTLSNASGADLGTATATGTIRNRTVVVETTPSVSIASGSGTEGDDDEIDFTVTLDEAASTTVTVDYATSDGTADAGDDYTSTSGTLSFSAGTTSKTISVEIADDIENESDETFTVTLSNPSGADLGTSSATGTIENRYVAPLTARFENMPSEHDGSEFTFELHFSENAEVPYRRLRDRSFTLVEADVTRAKRLNPQAANKNQSWTITVKPDGNEQIGITLPAAVSCTDNKSICTHDGRKLSHSTSATVAGPVGISVDDVEVVEGANVVLAFAVSLTRAATSSLTIDYATSDGTATAGSDYTSTSGTLTIGAGSSSGSIEVAVLDDEHNEGSETMTLTLSSPSSGVLTDSSATGTITNHDALPAAMVARFGRTAALHVVEMVEERVDAPRAPGFDGRVAGQRIHRDMGQEFALSFLQQLGGGYARPGTGMPSANGGVTSSLGPQGHMSPQGMQGAGMQNAGVPSGGLQGMGMQSSSLEGPMRHSGGLHQDTGFGFGMGGRDQVLQGSGFALNRATKTGGVLSFWSRSAQSSFYGQDGALALNGDVRSTMVGADYSKGRMVTGVSLAHSRGLGGYAGGADTGRMTSAVTGLYPWIGFKASERVTVWTVAGYGAGGLLLDPGAGAPIETGLSMAMAAGGGRGELMTSEAGFELAFKADALWVGTRTDAASGASGNLRATRAGVTRLRTALEGSKSTTIAARMAFTPSVEVGIRQDGGDAEVGRGLDVGLGLVVADGVTGLGVDVRVRRLLVHQADGFEENGVSVSVSYDPTPKTPLGFTARVSPAWGGDAMSGADALWGRESMGGMGQDRLLGGGGNRLDTELGYGLPIGARFVGTPRVGLRTSEYGRDYRVGYGMQVLEQGKLNLELGIDAERRESPVFHLQEGSAGTDQRVLGRATVQW